MASTGTRLSVALSADAVVAARRVMEKAKRDVQHNLSPHNRTMNMSRSVRYRVRPNRASITLTLRCDDPAASFVDLGTRTPIRSTRPGGRMAVFARTGGPVVWRHEVKGQKATRFFSKVADQLAARMARELARK